MKKWFLALVLALPIGLQAQKIDVDDGILTVDGVPYCRLEKIKTGLVADYRVLSLDSTALIFLKRRAYNDPSHVNQTNTKGEVAYFEWTFLASGAKAETDQLGQKAIAKKLHAAGLIKNGALDAEAERNFISIEGQPHSKRQEQLGQPVIILSR